MPTIEVPCNIGDKIYLLSQDGKSVCPEHFVADAIHITSDHTTEGHKRKSYVLARCEVFCRLQATRVYFDKFGKTAFLSLIEAQTNARYNKRIIGENIE